MSKDYWHLLRGYREPKSDILSAYADSILSFASYAAGVREVVLKEPITVYHIDHPNRFDEQLEKGSLPLQNWLPIWFLPPLLKRKGIGLWNRMLQTIGYRPRSYQRGIPTLHVNEYQKLCRDIVAGKTSYIINDEDWGLGQESLKEYIVNRANWDYLDET